MGTLHIDELLPGMKLEAEVRGVHNRKLFPAGIVLGEQQIAIMKAWGVTEASVAGVSRKDISDQTPKMISPEIMIKATQIVDDSFQGKHVGNAFLEEFHRLCVLRTAKRIQDNTLAPMSEARLKALRARCEMPTPDEEQHTAASLVKSEVTLLSFPSVYTQILKELQSPACSARRMGEVVSRDPGLTAKILRLVNSPFYGFPSRIDTIERAITILGVNELTTLAIGISATSTFSNIPSSVLNMQHFWEHSVSCGTLARLIAGTKPGLSEERFFVAGLLHDIGMLLMLRAMPQSFCRALLLSRDRKIPLEQAEQEVCGFDHSEVGGLLLEAWGIPDSLTHMVRHHHAPLKSQPLLDAAIIQLGDMIALGLRSDDYGAFYAPDISPQVLEAIGLPPSSLEPIILQHGRQLSEMISLFIKES
ncbi:HDOD domain-containing protein [Desulfovibrio mangrovi]|uniref:HDOD domain-containing protein n=1 Tax=Desulfovibrio mangrovi TaxID=2976983 RepID=UPI0022470DFB|nr:HDOD domain-containing protein [Desulfovibrio mangrovi]UZP66090.1 HDOD domain-containing protein [Desulfovibrio mangrovi]